MGDKTTQADDWIDVQEQLPKEKGPYICALPYPVPHVNVVWFNGIEFMDHVVLWQPLPDIPEDMKRWRQANARRAATRLANVEASDA